MEGGEESRHTKVNPPESSLPVSIRSRFRQATTLLLLL